MNFKEHQFQAQIPINWTNDLEYTTNTPMELDQDPLSSRPPAAGDPNADSSNPSSNAVPLSLPLQIPPSPPGQSHFLVDFPGYVQNEDRALATLGGLIGLASQRQAHPKTLHVRLRPGDPSCHALISDEVRRTTSIVVKLKQTNATNATTPPEIQNVSSPTPAPTNPSSTTATANHNGTVTAEVVALINKSYSFSAPADFQYVGRDRRPTEVQWVARPERSEDDPDYLPPQPLLCTPSLFAVEPAIDYAFKQYRARDSGIDVLGRKPKRSTGAQWIDFFAKEIPSEVVVLPPQPSSTAGAGAVAGGVTAMGGTLGNGITTASEVLAARVQELFTRRPVYVEAALRTALGDISSVVGSLNQQNGGAVIDAGGTSASAAAAAAADSTKQQQHQHQHQQGHGLGVFFLSSRSHTELLSRLCYRFRNGPWKGTWVKRGYDPRKDPNARQYQVLDYSLPADSWKKVLRYKESSSSATGNQSAHHQLNNNNSNNNNNFASTSVSAGANSLLGLPPLATSYPALCAFAGIPATQSTQLQLCDINDPQIRKSLADNANVAAAVNDGTGWLTQASWEGIKSQVAHRFDEVWRKAAAETGVSATQGSGGADAGTVVGGGATIKSIKEGERGGILPASLLYEVERSIYEDRERHGGGPRDEAEASGEEEEDEEEEEQAVHDEEDEDEDDEDEDEEDEVE